MELSTIIPHIEALIFASDKPLTALEITELVNTALVAGNYQYQWNAQNVATGMYNYELRTDNFVSVKKMMLMKFWIFTLI